MARRALVAMMLLSLCLLSGCASFLDREYTVSEPHSSKYWESEAADTLRAENYQDIVNDLLLLIGQHTETAALRLYGFSDDLSVSGALEAATVEIQQETPLGAYAVDYITFSSQAQRSYYEVALEISYRRTAEQIQSIRSATSASAVSSLLETALENDAEELALRIAYWGENGQAIVENAAAQLRQSLEIPEDEVWVIYYYPQPFSGTVAMVEFLLKPSQEEIDAYLASLPPEEPAEPENGAESGSENGEDTPVPEDGEADVGETQTAPGEGDGGESPVSEAPPSSAQEASSGA